MPISRTFSEELVLEWLTLSGYLVELGIPVPKKGRRGRNEVDLVGVRNAGGKLEVLHVEVGAWPGYEDVKAKFAPHIKTLVENHVRNILNYKGEVEYVKQYIAIYRPMKRFDGAKVPGIKVWDFQSDFVDREVRETVKQWRKTNPRTDGGYPELPESMWLLKTLDFAIDLEPEP